MYSKHKLTLEGIATAILHNPTITHYMVTKDHIALYAIFLESYCSDITVLS